MATITFDTYKAVKLLRERGFKKEQAEGLLEVTKEINVAGVATKEDLVFLKQDLAQLETKIYKAMFLQSFVIVGLMATIIKLL